MPEARSVSLGAWVRVGARDEPDELWGASHFLEHLLFKGTEDRSARQLAEAVDSVGGEMNAFTAHGLTAYYALLPHQRVQLGIEILGAVLTEPALRAGDVDAERQVIVEEILMNLDSPEDRAHALARARACSTSIRSVVTCSARSKPSNSSAGTTSPPSSTAGTAPASIVVAAAGRVDHAEVVAAVAAGVRRPLRRRGARSAMHRAR